MVAPTQYRSTDASAPVLTGAADSLNALLYACLVTGYGAKAAAGWTRPYSSGSYSCYQQGAGLGHVLQVLDSNTQLSRVVGFVTMSSAILGTEQFPTEAQVTGGLYCRKSITASATARPWIMLANNEHFYLVILGGGTVLTTPGGGDSHLAFGQLRSPRLTGDVKHSFLIAATDTSTTSTTATATRQVLSALGTAALAGHYQPTTYLQTGAPSQFSKRADNSFVQTTSGLGGPAYPDTITGAFNISRMISVEGTQLIRGTLPGVWAISHTSITGYAHLDTFSGTGGLSGRAWLILLTASGSLAFETTDGSW